MQRPQKNDDTTDAKATAQVDTQSGDNFQIETKYTGGGGEAKLCLFQKRIILTIRST